MPRFSKSMLLLAAAAVTILISTSHGFQFGSEVAPIKPDTPKCSGAANSIKASEAKPPLFTKLNYDAARQAPPVSRLRKPSKIRDKIEKALLEKTTLKFKNTPLQEALAVISGKNGIDILLDKSALADAGTDAKEPITLELDGIKLGSALKILFEPLELTIVIKNEVLNVTTVYEAEESMTISVYDVRKLTKAGYTGEMLMQIITRQTQALWTETSGSGGSLNYLPGCLTVRQAELGHQEVFNLLTLLEKMTEQPVKPKR